MKRNLIVELITDPTKNFLASFVVGTLLFGIVSDGVSAVFWELLNQWATPKFGIQYAWFRAGVVIMLVLLVLTVIYGTNLSRWVKQWLSWLPFVQPVPLAANVVPLEHPYPGLIVAMSPKEDSPAERVILHHWNQGRSPHLRHCWLICTAKSLPFATRMVQRLATQGITEQVEIHYGNYQLTNGDTAEVPLNLLIPDDQIDDPHYVHRLVDGIYADAIARGLDETEVIADYTGATKGMTAGILLACLSPDRPLQYISQVQFPQIMAVRIAYRLKRI